MPAADLDSAMSDQSPVKLIIGLGNPGRRYAHTRHNIGFDVLDELAKRYKVRILRRTCRALVATIDVAGLNVFLAKPQTFMNLSGDSVYELCKKFDIASNELIVVYDDLDLPLGKIRLRLKGSAGGHKGMESIIQRLKTNEIKRIRIGIGRNEGETVDYVLSRFSKNELEAAKLALKTAADALEMALNENFESAMNIFNRDRSK